MIYSLMPIVFFAAILCVAFEDKINVNKAATTILSAIALWAMLILGGQNSNTEITKQLIEHLGDVSTTLFFVMSSMVIIELVDAHGGFRVITTNIQTRNKRKLLWIICLLTFFLSAVLDNLATAIVMIAILRKFISHRTERLIFASLVIIAANAGGSWSPIGDVTTILLWSGGNLTPAHQIVTLILPAFMCMIVPVAIAARLFKKNEVWETQSRIHFENTHVPQIRKRSRYSILIIGVLSLAMVPVFTDLTGLPPFMGVMGGLSILWIYTDLMYKRTDMSDSDKLPLIKILHRLDMATILFFFGILMSIAALNTAGHLQQAAGVLDRSLHDPKLIAFILGICSSFLDNVALVAGAMGMYPIASSASAAADPYMLSYVVNGEFWTFLAYCCVTGGSILIIGSATGVAIMGMEKIKFMYYLKNFTLLALTGYIAGAITYLLISYI